jgi:quinol monooxygenase YgiN
MSGPAAPDGLVLIVGHSRAADEAARDAAVRAFAGMVERARAQDGCIEFAISADAIEADRVNLVEVWRDAAAIAAWRKVARGPRVRLTASKVSLYRSPRAEKP